MRHQRNEKGPDLRRAGATETLRVGIIANEFQPAYIANLVNALARGGAAVDLVGSALNDPATIDPAVRMLDLHNVARPGASLAAKAMRFLRYFGRLIAYASAAESRVFHVQWIWLDVLEGVLLNLLFKAFGKRIVYTAHNVLPHGRETAATRMLYRVIYRIADRVIAHTPAIRRRLVREFGVKEGRIALVKHGVYEAPDDPRIDRKRAREELGVGAADRVVLFFGYIREYKGLDVLVPSFVRCRAELPGLKLIIAGSVFGEYRPALDRLLAGASLGEALTAKLGYVSDREAEILFKAADVVVLPYAEASQSGVLFLSYAYGRPVIVSNIGSFPEDVVEGKTGYVFRVGDSGDLARTIARFFADVALRRDEAEREIKAFAAANYSWAASARELLAVYRALASSYR